MQQAITICRAEEKTKLFPDQDLDHDPYFDGDPFKEDPDQRNPDLIRMRKKTRTMLAEQTRYKLDLNTVGIQLTALQLPETSS